MRWLPEVRGHSQRSGGEDLCCNELLPVNICQQLWLFMSLIFFESAVEHANFLSIELMTVVIFSFLLLSSFSAEVAVF